MFGQQPGNERRHGVMNVHVVTKLDGHKITYYVLHTRGEDPKSVLITTLTKEVSRTKVKAEADDFVYNRISEIFAQTLYATAKEYDRVKDTECTMWGQTKKAALGEIVNAATGSCVLAFVKDDGDE